MLQTLLEQLLQNSGLELIAVALAVLYLLLAVKENLYCWHAAFFFNSDFFLPFLASATLYGVSASGVLPVHGNLWLVAMAADPCRRQATENTALVSVTSWIDYWRRIGAEWCLGVEPHSLYECAVTLS